MKCEACRAFDLFFAKSLINSIIQEHANLILFFIWYYDYSNISFLASKVILLSLYTQRCYGRHKGSRKSVNH